MIGHLAQEITTCRTGGGSQTKIGLDLTIFSDFWCMVSLHTETASFKWPGHKNELCFFRNTLLLTLPLYINPYGVLEASQTTMKAFTRMGYLRLAHNLNILSILSLLGFQSPNDQDLIDFALNEKVMDGSR